MIADNLKRLMLAAGLKPKSLSLKAGLNETYVRDILVGKSKQPRLACLERLAWALDCSSEELQGRQEIAPIIDPERLRLAMLVAQDVFRGPTSQSARARSLI